MKPKIVGCSTLALAAVACATGMALAQPRPPECNRTAPFPTGPDVIVGELSDIAYFNQSGGIHAFAVGTTSCNIGTENLLWVAGTNEHPVIAQNMYRLKDGRFEQIGMSWLKHGFTALTQNLCSTCNGSGGAVLGVGCSDPYVASLNGTQSRLGPRWQVNPTTGVFTYPFANPAYSGNLPRRLQVADADLNPALNAGAQYFVEGQYVTQDDAAAGHSANNTSYRKVNFNYSPSNITYTWAGNTQCTKPAIQAWRDHGLGANIPDPGVTIVSVDVPGDGRFWVAAKVTDNADGTWHYEYAIQNLTSDRSAGGVRVPLVLGAFPENIEFKGCPYHSGDGIPTNPASPNTTARNYSGADWATSFTTSQVRWSTEDFASNTNANALRWGTLYNFRFDTNAQPGTGGPLVIELFKPGSGANTFTEVEVPGLPVPTTFVPRNVRVVLDMASVPSLIPPSVATTILANVFAGNDQVAPGSTRLFYKHSNNPADPFIDIPMNPTGEPNQFSASVPGASCGNFVSLYVQAQGSSSGTVTSPLNGPNAPVVRAVGLASEKFAQTFDTDAGWSGVDPSDTATTGRWVRGTPIGTLFNPGSGNVYIQPNAAFSGANCWFTGQGPIGGNVSAADVDGGTTTLTSPTVDLSRVLTARLEYWRWFISGISTQVREDPFVVQVSNNGGSTWSDLEIVPATAGQSAWVLAQVPINIPLTSNMKFRFIARDLGTDQIVEAAIDDLVIKTTECNDLCPADWNQVNGVTVQDIFDFIGDYAVGNADFNNDSSTTIQDIFDFVDAYFSPC
ncbi:MAG: hypothetical protein ACK4WH_05635 [Phycisphaerales bacterium]